MTEAARVQRNANERSLKNCRRKRQYSTRKTARSAKERAAADYGRKMEFYRCPHCRFYHLATVKGITTTIK